jgi:hypothetical protein
VSGEPLLTSRVARLPDATVDRLFALLAIGVGIALVVVGFGLTFVVDEWNYIAWAADPSPNDLVRPFNGHWTALPVLIYRALLGTVGMRTYVPYHVGTVLTLVLAAGALYVLARRRAGGWVALGVASVYLLFGSGYENFWWGFQMGFVGSVAAGLWAFVALDGQPTDRRRAVAAVLFGVAITAGSPGAILLGGAIVMALVRRDVRTVVALATPALAYAAWYVGTASQRPATLGGNGTPLLDAPVYVLEGFAMTVGAAIGLPGAAPAYLGAVVLAVMCAAAFVLGWRPSATLVGLFAAVVALFASVALLRGYLGIAGVSSSRYLYVGAPLIGLLIAEVAPTIGPAARSRGRRVSVVLATAAILVLDLALIGNVRLLVDARGWAERASREVRAALDVLTGPDGAACDIDAVETTPDEVVVATMPTPTSANRLIAAFGDPRVDVLVPWAVVPPVDADHALARRLLCRS